MGLYVNIHFSIFCNKLNLVVSLFPLEQNFYIEHLKFVFEVRWFNIWLVCAECYLIKLWTTFISKFSAVDNDSFAMHFIQEYEIDITGNDAGMR